MNSDGPFPAAALAATARKDGTAPGCSGPSLFPSMADVIRWLKILAALVLYARFVVYLMGR